MPARCWNCSQTPRGRWNCSAGGRPSRLKKAWSVPRRGYGKTVTVTARISCMPESAAIVSPEVEFPDPPAGPPLGRRLLHGTIVYGATNFGLKGVNFGLVVLYTRFLTPADFGTVALAEIVAAIMAAVSSLGLTAAIQPLYFSYVGERTTLHRCISTLLRFGAAATVFFL